MNTQSNLPPESQPWAREVDERAAALEASLESGRRNELAQLKGAAGGLDLLAQRLLEIQGLPVGLPAGQTLTFEDKAGNLASSPASTWVTVQQNVVTQPSSGRTTVKGIITSTAYIAQNLPHNAILMRMSFNGSNGPVTALGSSASGYCVSGISLSGVSSVSIRVQVFMYNPTLVTNNTTFPNAFRTVAMTVWS